MTILPRSSLLNQINQFIRGDKFSLNYGLFLLSWKSGLRVSEAISFDYQLKHPRHKDLYSVKGKGQKKRYVYVSPSVISELKTNNWKPNQTNRFSFNNFLKKVKEKLNISKNIELTPHTLRRCFTTHNSLNGVPMPILQKALGHKNIRTTSCYWKGSINIRKFSGWLEPNPSPQEPEETPEVEINPKIPVELTKPSLDNSKEPKLLKTIAKLKGELADKDQQITLLTNKNENLKTITQEKDKKLKDLTAKNNSLLQNYIRLKNTAENISKSKENKQLEISPENSKLLLTNSPNALLEIKEQKNSPLVTKEQEVEFQAQIQVWKPPN